MSLKSLLKPPTVRKALQSKFPSNCRGHGLYSTSSRITFHQQACLLFDGSMKFFDLKAYLKDGRQYGRTTGKRPLHFIKHQALWERVG